jgi:double zinc ribbon protein
MPPIAYFGIESSGLTLAIDLLILFVAVVYLALVYWTYADAGRRIEDPMLVGCATAAALFPFVGTLVYMILRPPEYLEDVRERELEMHAAEARLSELDYSLCPHCDYRVERDFIRCPSCLRKLKERCTTCSRPLDRAWTICPYCEAEVPSAKPARRSSSRRSERTVTAKPAPAAPRAAVEAESAASAVESKPLPRESTARTVESKPLPRRSS